MTNQSINDKIIAYLVKYEPYRIAVFGSYARNENTKDSDLDILIHLKKSISLLELVKIQRELSDITGIKVDLLTQGALKNNKLKNYIEKDLKIIYQC